MAEVLFNSSPPTIRELLEDNTELFGAAELVQLFGHTFRLSVHHDLPENHILVLSKKYAYLFCLTPNGLQLVGSLGGNVQY